MHLWEEFRAGLADMVDAPPGARQIVGFSYLVTNRKNTP
jgi:hypothetical protein